MSDNLKWTLIFDAAKCNGCNNCTMATRDEYVGNSFPGYAEEMPLHGHRWIDLQSHERGKPPIVDVTYFPMMCQHCEEPACAKVAPPGAVRKRADGIVVIDPLRSKGARQMVDACPFGAIWWNSTKDIPQHWNFDAHLLDSGWSQPRCAQACPTGAIVASQMSESEYDLMLASGEALAFRSTRGKPRVLYKGIEALHTEFVGGTLVKQIGHEEFDCVVGVAIRLIEGGHVLGEVVSDAFGDFKIDGIDCSTPRKLQVIVGANAAILSIEISSSIYLGRIVIPSPTPTSL